MLVLRLRPLHFFAAFAIGLLVSYMMTPAPKVVVKFPSPYNAGSVVYKDDADNCFKFNAKKVSCADNRAAIRPQPLTVEDFGQAKQAARSIDGTSGAQRA